MHGPTGDHWRTYGLAAAARGDWTTAADALNRYLAAAPHDTEAHYTLATVYLQAGRPDYAVQLLDGLVRVQPQNPDAAYYRGCVFQQSGRQAEAMADFHRAVALNPAHLGALQALRGTGVPNLLPGQTAPGHPLTAGAPLPTLTTPYAGPGAPAYPVNSMMTTTTSDSDDLISLVAWGAIILFGIVALVLTLVGIGMTTSRSGNLAIGWLVLSLGLLVGVGVVAGIIYLTRREIHKV